MLLCSDSLESWGFELRFRQALCPLSHLHGPHRISYALSLWAGFSQTLMTLYCSRCQAILYLPSVCHIQTCHFTFLLLFQPLPVQVLGDSGLESHERHKVAMANPFPFIHYDPPSGCTAPSSYRFWLGILKQSCKVKSLPSHSQKVQPICR